METLDTTWTDRKERTPPTTREEAVAQAEWYHSFEGMTLRHLDLSDLSLADCIFAGAILEGVTFDRADLRGAVFDSATLTDCTFRYALMEGLNMKHVQCHGRCIFDVAFMAKVVAHEGTFASASFIETNLEDAEFDDCTMNGADLTGAECPNTSFVRCQMVGTKLGIKRSLSGIDLMGALVREEDQTQALWNRTPTGPIAPTSG